MPVWTLAQKINCQGSGGNNVRHFEDMEQAALFEWAAYYPILKWMYAIPNGGNRNPKEAARLKAQGVKKGVTDVCLPIPHSPFHGLYIEMKRRKVDGRSTVTPDQNEFIGAMQMQGYKCVVCYGSEEAIDAIKTYLGDRI